MRKYLVGFIVGALFMSAFPAYGAVSSLVGKKVSGEFSVKVDGTEIAGKSVAIDGTTYAPLRAIGDATGYTVTFENKEVVFTKKENGGGEPVATNQPTETQSSGEDPNSARLSELEEELSELRLRSVAITNEIGPLGVEYIRKKDESIQAKIDELKAEYAQVEAKIKELEAEREMLKQ